MAKFINIGDTIVAKHADGHARKIVWKGARKHPITNKLMTLYECDRNSVAEIMEACTGEVEEGTEHFNRNIGDQLQADAISIYVESIRKEKFKVKEGVSATHGAMLFRFRDRSISTIKTPLQNLMRHLNEISNENKNKKIEN